MTGNRIFVHGLKSHARIVPFACYVDFFTERGTSKPERGNFTRGERPLLDSHRRSMSTGGVRESIATPDTRGGVRYFAGEASGLPFSRT